MLALLFSVNEFHLKSVEQTTCICKIKIVRLLLCLSGQRPIEACCIVTVCVSFFQLIDVNNKWCY